MYSCMEVFIFVSTLLPPKVYEHVRCMVPGEIELSEHFQLGENTNNFECVLQTREFSKEYNVVVAFTWRCHTFVLGQQLVFDFQKQDFQNMY